MEPVLSVADLRVSFGSARSWTPVVHGVSFDVHAGSTVAVVGESGSGKSVTALSILRLLPDETSRIEGTIKLNGRRLLDLSEREMESVRGNQVAMIFQEPMTSLNPTMPVGRQIAEALMAHSLMGRNAAKKAAIRLLERGRRFIGNQQFRLAGQRHGDHDALAHAARQEVRKVVIPCRCRRDTYALQQPDGCLFGRVPAHKTVCHQGFGNLSAHRHGGIEAALLHKWLDGRTSPCPGRTSPCPGRTSPCPGQTCPAA